MTEKYLKNPNIEELNVLKHFKSVTNRWFVRWFVEEEFKLNMDFELIHGSSGKETYYHKVVDGCSCLTEDPKAATPVVVGTVKWDHCTNYMFPEQEEAMLHACSREEFMELGAALTAVHEFAQKIIGEKWCE